MIPAAEIQNWTGHVWPVPLVTQPDILTMQFSLVLLRPNVAAVAIWLVGHGLIPFQVRFEESFSFGAAQQNIVPVAQRRWI